MSLTSLFEFAQGTEIPSKKCSSVYIFFTIQNTNPARQIQIVEFPLQVFQVRIQILCTLLTQILYFPVRINKNLCKISCVCVNSYTHTYKTFRISPRQTIKMYWLTYRMIYRWLSHVTHGENNNKKKSLMIIFEYLKIYIFELII